MDARYEKARVGGRVVSQGVLIVSAVREDGLREILGVEVADTESEATYQELFRALKGRGLKGGLRLVVALAVEQSEEWVTGRRYLDMKELRKHRRSEDREAEGVMLMER